MTKSHRRFHKLFWLIAAPLLVLFYVMFQTSKTNHLMPPQDIPNGSSIAIFQIETDRNSAEVESSQ